VTTGNLIMMGRHIGPREHSGMCPQGAAHSVSCFVKKNVLVLCWQSTNVVATLLTKNKSQIDLDRLSDLPGTVFNENYYDWRKGNALGAD
jgi:hypothetical protein